MAGSNGTSSPDPLTLPSSAHISPEIRKRNQRSRAQKVTNQAKSPSKSIILQSPTRNGESPWRIKVTVQAQPTSADSKMDSTHTKSFLLTERVRSSESAKRSSSEEPEGEGPRRRQKTRQGGYSSRLEVNSRNSVQRPVPHIAEDYVSTQPVSARFQPRARQSRLSAIPAASERSKRLSIARDELDQALRNAIGTSSPPGRGEPVGDMTVSANEDFSMVSMESLISAKNTSFSRLSAAETSLVNSSHPPSSPPKVQYPEISGPARQARASLGRTDYDAMSWKPTGPATDRSADPGPTSYDPMSWKPTSLAREPTSASQVTDTVPEWSQKRNARTLSGYNSPPDSSEVTHNLQSNSQPDEAAHYDDDDIWQEEASRSLQEEQIPTRNSEEQSTAAKQPNCFDDLFADEPLKPPRPKIPRTWRRTSGHDFSYVDSPARTAPRSPKHSSGSADESGVLTPPSSDEERATEQAQHHKSSQNEHSDLTHPDAAGTQFEERNLNCNARSDPVLISDDGDETSAYMDSDSSVSSPDAEDTGLFWQSNLPALHQNNSSHIGSRLRFTSDRTGLLNADVNHRSAVRPAASTDGFRSHRLAVERRHEARYEAQTMSNEATTQLTSEKALLEKPISDETKTASASLRRSLLTSNKPELQAQHSAERTGVSTRLSASNHRRTFPNEVHAGTNRQSIDAEREDGVVRSQRPFDPVASQQHDQSLRSRGLYRPTLLPNDRPQLRPTIFEDTIKEEEAEETYPSPSYQEHLNRESPAKIQVNFNDSSINNTSLLAPPKRYKPLVANNTSHSPPTNLDITTSHSPPPTLLNRLATTFWSTLIRPSGPTSILPPPPPSSSLHSSSSTSFQPDPFPPTLRTQLRNRYGVIPSHFPWTMAHMRTLHRMLNSRQTNRTDTLIPSSGALTPHPLLTTLVDTTQTSITGREFLFSRQHAYVVSAFLQVLVPMHVIHAMRTGDVEWLGDKLAKELRGFYGERHGDEGVWKVGVHREEVVRRVEGMKGEIGVRFVVGALGDVVWSNEAAGV